MPPPTELIPAVYSRNRSGLRVVHVTETMEQAQNHAVLLGLRTHEARYIQRPHVAARWVNRLRGVTP